MVRRGAVLAVAVVGVLLAGCDGGEPTDSPSGSSGGSSNGTTSASPTPSEEESTRAAVERGPVKTVRAWVDGYNEVVRSGDTSDVDEVTTSSCDSCREYVDSVAETHANGGHYEGYGWVDLSVKRDPDFVDNHRVHAAIRLNAGRMWPQEGADPVAFDEETWVLTFELTERSGSWLVASVFAPAG